MLKSSLGGWATASTAKVDPRFQLVILNFRIWSPVMTCRWHRHRKHRSGELLSKPGLIILLSDSSLGSVVYNHVLVFSIPPRRVNTNLILPTIDNPIFGTDAADYGPKWRCWSWWSLLRNGKIWRMISPIIVGNLQPLGYVPITLGPINCPFLRQARG